MNATPHEDPSIASIPEEISECCQTMSSKTEEALSRTKIYASQNPVPIVLGAIALGAVLGYLMVVTRREEPTLRERFVDEPLQTAREAIYAVLAPVASRLHEGYDSVRTGAEKTMGKLNHTRPSRAVDSLFDQIGRVGSNLKFW